MLLKDLLQVIWLCFPDWDTGFSHQIRREEILDNHHIAPDSIELSVFLIDADFTKAEPPVDAPAARLIFHKNV